MLSELWQYLTTPCDPVYRKSGHLKELIAMRARYQRVKTAWQPHLDNSKQFIESVIDNSTQRNQAIVLGSGLLLDIPIERLSREFNLVILVDIVHLRSVRKQLAGYLNIRCLEQDISGLIHALVNLKKNDKNLPQPRFCLPVTVTDNDLIISANIASQLPVMPLEYVQKHFPMNHRPSEAKLYNWAHDIIANHLNSLRKLPARVCLITDTQSAIYDKQGTLLREEALLYGNALPPADKNWQWQLAPYGEISPQHKEEHPVQAYGDFTASTRQYSDNFNNKQITNK